MSDTRRRSVENAPGAVVIAASFGGVTAAKSVLSALPADFPLPILLVQHRHGNADLLAPILAQHTALSVAEPRDGETLRPGAVFVLPADRQASLDTEHRLRFMPAVRCRADPILESAAFAFGDGVTAVILTGKLNDGSAGVRAVKRRGGRVLAQDEETCEAFGMPGAAIATGCVDFVLPLQTIPAALIALTMVHRGPWASAA
jgi:two-component system chemotaxis response regulator CheB